MHKTISLILIISSTIGSLRGQANKKYAEFVEIFNKGKDTLTFYTRESNCDSVIFYKNQIFKGTKDLIIKTYSPVIIKQPKRCKDVLNVSPEMLKFKQVGICSHSNDGIELINEFELGIRNSREEQTLCNEHFKFKITIGGKSYSSKTKSCNKDISIKINNYFGCAVIDSDTKWQQ